MSSETVPEQELLTIEEEMERCEDEDDEVQMLDVDERLAEDPEVLEARVVLSMAAAPRQSLTGHPEERSKR